MSVLLKNGAIIPFLHSSVLFHLLIIQCFAQYRPHPITSSIPQALYEFCYYSRLSCCLSIIYLSHCSFHTFSLYIQRWLFHCVSLFYYLFSEVSLNVQNFTKIVLLTPLLKRLILSSALTCCMYRHALGTLLRQT